VGVGRGIWVNMCAVLIFATARSEFGGENAVWVRVTSFAVVKTTLPRRRGIPVTETQVHQVMWFVATISLEHLLGV
jgi:hypothetical protein